MPRPAFTGALTLALIAYFFVPDAPKLRPTVEIAPAAAATLPPRIERRVRAGNGTTLAKLLANARVDASDARDAIAALQPLWDPRDLRAGQEIVLSFDAGGLEEMQVAAAIDRDIVVARGEPGRFTSHERQRALHRATDEASGVIRTSLFEAARNAGVPVAALSAMIHAFSYDVDFQREVQPGDSFDVVYERLLDDNGNAVGTGDVIYATMTLSGRTLRLFRYRPPGADTADYFTADGVSVRKALVRTPIDGARLSSSFGMRHHPVLGYTAMHRGVDFAAPTGTPITAAGDGTVASAGRSSSYGNLVVLHHGGGYDTAYAHMSRLAAGLKPGQRVRQGEVIGYVGATGRATGPHLHYEIRLHGNAVNPMTVKMEPGQRLHGEALVAFRDYEESVSRALLAQRTTDIVALAAIP